MAIAKRATLAVLASHADGHAFGDERGKRECFGMRPIDSTDLGKGRTAFFKHAYQFGIDAEIIGGTQQLRVVLV